MPVSMHSLSRMLCRLQTCKMLHQWLVLPPPLQYKPFPPYFGLLDTIYYSCNIFYYIYRESSYVHSYFTKWCISKYYSCNDDFHREFWPWQNPRWPGSVWHCSTGSIDMWATCTFSASHLHHHKVGFSYNTNIHLLCRYFNPRYKKVSTTYKFYMLIMLLQ